MRIALLFLMLIALVACPVVGSAQSSRTTESKSGGGSDIKDSWITSKTKMKLVGDKRTKARRIKVETEHGTDLWPDGDVEAVHEAMTRIATASSHRWSRIRER